MIKQTQEIIASVRKLKLEGIPVTEISRKLHISRPTVYKILGMITDETLNADNSSIEAIVDKERKTAEILNNKLRDKHYGQIMEAVYGEYGITLKSGKWRKAIELCERYNVYSLNKIATLSTIMKKGGLKIEQLQSFDGDKFQYLASLDKGDVQFIITNIQPIMFLHTLLKTHEITGLIKDIMSENGTSWSEAVDFMAEEIIISWKHLALEEKRIEDAIDRRKKLNDETARITIQIANLIKEIDNLNNTKNHLETDIATLEKKKQGLVRMLNI